MSNWESAGIILGFCLFGIAVVVGLIAIGVVW